MSAQISVTSIFFYLFLKLHQNFIVLVKKHFKTFQWRSKNDTSRGGGGGGGGGIFVYSCSQTLKQSISKEIDNAEHEYGSLLLRH